MNELNDKRPLKIVIAGGGTGGHLFPGIAIAQEFKIRNSATNIIFVSTGNPMEKSVLSKTDFELRCIRVAGIKGRGIWNQLISVLKIPTGILESMRILKNFTPDLAIGLGSYSAGPVLIGAWLRRIPIAVHEQNLLPGITNRILSRFAERIYISFENTKSNLDPRKVRWTGNPVRRELLKFEDSCTGDSRHHTVERRFTILIIGGSQGAHRINMAVIEALEYLKDKGRLHFVHQTGNTDEQPVSAAYRRHGIQGTVQSFFDDMAEQYHRADLLICRAGATTVAEISALGKAAIFIPFPFAADNHQVLNAGSLSNEGAAEMILEKDLSGEILAEKIEYYADHPAALKHMAVKARRFGNPEAAKNIVDDCYRLIEERCAGRKSRIS
ncbi:MAG: undecaprenyldiphospho-muramoylpentapeptide beta-N-acetylglucosaminyltransferase [Deltaproteobacteria bacterium]|jgi:UDP-N-acetylglucosamine--N-acetylmuramyl-(pentapeptide) pyrophosphoryl-undecaprenol N-acetylglucosamine transferase|nr:undecaprenyldiphospho-muramoylpentapeptide beta-N-acetylglucosaminyltransferase [Deltaproteobacteria bacterium]